MYKIQCNKAFKGEGNKKAFVSNHPKASESASFSQTEAHAHVFTDLGACKNVRDDVLYVAESVTILKV